MSIREKDRVDELLDLIRYDLNLEQQKDLKDLLEGEIEDECEDKNLCPHCLDELQPGGFKTELMGYQGSAPAYDSYPTFYGCESCRYWRDC